MVLWLCVGPRSQLQTLFALDVLPSVLQLINRKDGSPFMSDEESGALEIAKILGIAFHNQQRMGPTNPRKPKLLDQVELSRPSLPRPAARDEFGAIVG